MGFIFFDFEGYRTLSKLKLFTGIQLLKASENFFCIFGAIGFVPGGCLTTATIFLE